MPSDVPWGWLAWNLCLGVFAGIGLNTVVQGVLDRRRRQRSDHRVPWWRREER